MASEDLFDEEGMVRMTFGEHLEDLRRRIILALLGFLPGVIIGLCIGKFLVKVMSDPVVGEIRAFYQSRRDKKEAELAQAIAQGKELERVKLRLLFSHGAVQDLVRSAFPSLPLLETEPGSRQSDRLAEVNTRDGSGDQTSPSTASNPDAKFIEIEAEVYHEQLRLLAELDIYPGVGLITLSPQESFVAYMKVSIIAGLVISSPWVVFQLWAFVAEGLYRHERRIVYRAMPMSIGLFLVGVVFCFVVVLPVVIRFFFSFNKWMDIDPNIRLSEWLGFATILPVIFGACFELPLVMLVLEKVGILRYEDYTRYWRHAILAIAIIAMVVTPTTDPGSMMLLMGPMTALYGLGLWLVRARQVKEHGLKALSAGTKLRLLAIIAATVYAAAMSVGFAIPGRWIGLEDGWWFEQVWRVATLSKYLPSLDGIGPQDASWIWAITVTEAALVGLVVYRIGQVTLRVAQRIRRKRVPPQQKSD